MAIRSDIPRSGLESFRSEEYQRHNRRRQEHLASLHLDLANKSVLEIGAGLGDHTDFFLARGCTVTATDARPECVAYIANRFPSVRTLVFNANGEPPPDLLGHDIVYAYGVLYHLRNPEKALTTMAGLCLGMLLLETCVSPEHGREMPLVTESLSDPTQALDGVGSRPTREWVLSSLRSFFPYAYVTKTQPWHEEFPVDWTTPCFDLMPLKRSVFVASRQPLGNPFLSRELTDNQTRD